MSSGYVLIEKALVISWSSWISIAITKYIFFSVSKLMPASFSGLTIWFSLFPKTQDNLKTIDNYGYWWFSVSNNWHHLWWGLQDSCLLGQNGFFLGTRQSHTFPYMLGRQSEGRKVFQEEPKKLGLWYASRLIGRQGNDYRQDLPCLGGLCRRHLIWTSQHALQSEKRMAVLASCQGGDKISIRINKVEWVDLFFYFFIFCNVEGEELWARGK